MPLAGNSLSVSPPSPSPAHGSSVVLSILLRPPIPPAWPLPCLAEPCLALGWPSHNPPSYFLGAWPMRGLCLLGRQRGHAWALRAALVPGLLLSSCSTLAKPVLPLSPDTAEASEMGSARDPVSGPACVRSKSGEAARCVLKTVKLCHLPHWPSGSQVQPTERCLND